MFRMILMAVTTFLVLVVTGHFSLGRDAVGKPLLVILAHGVVASVSLSLMAGVGYYFVEGL